MPKPLAAPNAGLKRFDPEVTELREAADICEAAMRLDVNERERMRLEQVVVILRSLAYQNDLNT